MLTMTDKHGIQEQLRLYVHRVCDTAWKRSLQALYPFSSTRAPRISVIGMRMRSQHADIQQICQKFSSHANVSTIRAPRLCRNSQYIVSQQQNSICQSPSGKTQIDRNIAVVPDVYSQELQHQPRSTKVSCSRRKLLSACLAMGVGCVGVGIARPVQASLVQFPCSQLNNKYILVRAGESDSEAQDVILTNPAWKTSMAAGLSERGKAQVLRQTIPSMQSLGVCGEAGCWLWPSVTQNAYQTAEIVAGVLGVGRSRVVPEYSFLDARGVGALEGLRLGTVYDQVWGGDAQDINWRPPKGYDGTPPESTADVLTRMRQLLSVTETQYTGEDVVIITPDSDTLSVLQAAVLGLDLRRHAELAMRPGEVRPLLLSRQSPDIQPRSVPCPRPPSCV